jgi:hypothetical protein
MSLAIFATLITVISMFAPLIVSVNAILDPSDYYMTVPGVLDSDYYSLYPFEKNSLTVGFSKFGELVNPTVPSAAIGLDYANRDPFAEEDIPMPYWLQGWFADIRYVHRVYGARHVWAMATFGDLIDYGGDWINGATDPYGAPHGGRKTSGVAVTEPLTVLYDGPRRFVALCKTHLHDEILGTDFPLMDVMFTIVFEKVKKEVIIYKDIKLTIDQKILETPVNVQFSNRGEWDLGPYPDWKSYAHFYHQELETCYGADWTLAKKILREYVYEQTWSGATLDLDAAFDSEPDAFDVPVADRSEYVYVNGEWQVPGADYWINYATGVITFTPPIATPKTVKVVCKLHKGEYYDEGMLIPIDTPHEYDLAQIISRDKTHVGFVAFWPVTSDYTVDGWDKALEPLIDVDDEDMIPAGAEADIPYVIGEWDFMLDFDPGTADWGEQFRGVSVYGVTNYHNAQDSQMTGSPANKIDNEVQYQLDEVFVPWALVDMVHKETRSWVEWTSSTSWVSDHRPVVDVSDADWDQYCVFSERVITSSGTLLKRSQYNFYVDSDGYAHITGLPSGTKKILYHTLPNVEDMTTSDWTTVYTSTVTNTSTTSIPSWYFDYSWEDNLGVDYWAYFDVDSAAVAIADDTTNNTWSFSDQYEQNLEDFKVFLGETAYSEYWEWHNAAEIVQLGGANVTWDPDWIELEVTATDDPDVIDPLDDETVHVRYLDLLGQARVTVENYYNVSTATNYLNVTVEARWDAIWNTLLMGRQEWTVVGRDAETVDSAGAALVTAAFKNKQVEIGIAGADMMNPVIANQMPWVMANFDGGDAWADYLDTIERAALRDDWCRAGTVSGDEWPVASSNVIGVGGPLANLVSYYMNDFSFAFYGLNQFAHTDLADKIIALSCWNKNTYASSNTKGYAVISTYKDINSSVILQIWGQWGRDTFYATKWFHEEGVYQLQEAPAHLTDIILEISYQSTSEGYKPTNYKVVECLGTISECEWVHGYAKGGIHPDP